jgi:hypothetical protein
MSRAAKNRLHWLLTVAALVLAVLGSTSLGTAAVHTGVDAAKARLYASGVLTRPRRGPRGPRGFRGPPGVKGGTGPTGADGPRGSRVVARARGDTAVVASADPGTDDPLAGNTWVEPGGEAELVIGRIAYQMPACTNPNAFNRLTVNVYVDGSRLGSLTLFGQPPGATATFQSSVVVPPVTADTPRTLGAKISTNCAETLTVTDLKLDVLAVS